jgi:hypothetical protein
MIRRIPVFIIITLMLISFVSYGQNSVIPDQIKEINGKDITNLPQYIDYLEYYKNAQSAKANSTAFKKMLPFFEKNLNYLVYYKNKGIKEASVKEIFRGEFKPFSISSFIQKEKFSDNKQANENAVEAVSNFFSESGIEEFEKKISNSKNIQINDSYYFYDSIIRKIDGETVRNIEDLDKNIELIKASENLLVLHASEFSVKVYNKAAQEINEVKMNENVKVVFKYDLLGRADETVKINWKLAHEKEVVKEGSFEINCGKSGFLNLMDLVFDQDSVKGEYKFEAQADYNETTYNIIPYNFYVINPDISIIKIYTTDSTANTKEVKMFMPGETIVFVVLHEVSMSLGDNDKKIIDFDIFGPRGDAVKELSSISEVKAVKGKRISRCSKTIPSGIQPGKYVFNAKISVKGCTVNRSCDFVIKGLPAVIEEAYLTEARQSIEPVKNIIINKTYYYKAVCFTEKAPPDGKITISFQILDKKQNKIYSNTEESLYSDGKHIFVNKVSFPSGLSRGLYSCIVQLKCGSVTDRKVFTVEY